MRRFRNENVEGVVSSMENIRAEECTFVGNVTSSQNVSLDRCYVGASVKSSNGSVRLDESTVDGQIQGQEGVRIKGGEVKGRVFSPMGGVEAEYARFRGAVEARDNIVMQHCSVAGTLRSSMGGVSVKNSATQEANLDVQDVIARDGIVLRNTRCRKVSSSMDSVEVEMSECGSVQTRDGVSMRDSSADTVSVSMGRVYISGSKVTKIECRDGAVIRGGSVDSLNCFMGSIDASSCTLGHISARNDILVESSTVENCESTSGCVKICNHTGIIKQVRGKDVAISMLQAAEDPLVKEVRAFSSVSLALVTVEDVECGGNLKLCSSRVNMLKLKTCGKPLELHLADSIVGKISVRYSLQDQMNVAFNLKPTAIISTGNCRVSFTGNLAIMDGHPAQTSLLDCNRSITRAIINGVEHVKQDGLWVPRRQEPAASSSEMAAVKLCLEGVGVVTGDIEFVNCRGTVEMAPGIRHEGRIVNPAAPAAPQVVYTSEEARLERERAQAEMRQVQEEREALEQRRLALEHELQERRAQALEGGSSSGAAITCVVCTKGGPFQTFLPCGHVACCVECSKMVQQCPICRQTIEGRLNLFFP